MTCPQGLPPCVKATSSRPPIRQVRTFLRPAGRSYAEPIKRCGCSPPGGNTTEVAALPAAMGCRKALIKRRRVLGIAAAIALRAALEPIAGLGNDTPAPSAPGVAAHPFLVV